MKSYEDFKKKYKGKSIDIDGYYGEQCWDLYAQYCLYLGKPYAYCTTSTYVKDVWNNRTKNGMLSWCKVITSPKVGAIVIFKEAKGWTPYSHIGIVDKVVGNTIQVLGQNQGKTPHKVTLMTFPRSIVMGYLYPKCLDEPLQVTNTIVKEVIQGKYGNGQARVNALRKKGYSEAQIKEIQAKVNAYYTK